MKSFDRQPKARAKTTRLGGVESLEGRRMLAHVAGGDMSSFHGRSHGHNHDPSAYIQKRIDHEQAEIDAAVEAGEETVEGLGIADKQMFLDTASEQLAAGDIVGANITLGQLRAAEAPYHAKRRVENSIAHEQSEIDEAVEAGEETVEGIPIADKQAFLDTASGQLADGDVEGARATLDELNTLERSIRNAAKEASRVERSIAHEQSEIDEAVEAGEETVEGLLIADKQALVDTASEQLAAGDLEGARATLDEIDAAEDAVREQVRLGDDIAEKQAEVDAAVEAGEETVNGVAIADTETAIKTASGQLADGDLVGARATLDDLASVESAVAALAKVQAGIAGLEAAVVAANDAGETTIGRFEVATVEAAIVTANEALAADDLAAAQDAVDSVTEKSGGHDHGRRGGRHGGGRGRGRGGRH